MALLVRGRTHRADLMRSSIVHNLNQGSSKLKLAAARSCSFTGGIAATDGACNINGPVAIGPGNRALDGFVNADNAVNDVAMDLMFNGVIVPGTHADTFLTPGASATSPPEVSPGELQRPGLRLRRRREHGLGCASHLPGHADRRRITSAAPLPGAVEGVREPAAAVHARPGPWNMPSTDTRDTWCWVMAPVVTGSRGALASRGAWDHDHTTNSPTLTTRWSNARSATSSRQPRARRSTRR